MSTRRDATSSENHYLRSMTCVGFAKLSSLGVNEPLLTKKRRFWAWVTGETGARVLFLVYCTCINLYCGNFPLLEVGVPVITKNVVLSRSSRESMKSHRSHASCLMHHASCMSHGHAVVCTRSTHTGVCTVYTVYSVHSVYNAHTAASAGRARPTRAARTAVVHSCSRQLHAPMDSCVYTH
jgi:hypothetical protein